MSTSLPCRAIPCEPAPSTGVCVHCDHATCTSCGAPVAREDANPLHWVPSCAAPGVLCLACLALGAPDDSDLVTYEFGPFASDGEDSDGVPLPVSDDDTAAVLTVRIANVSTDELAAERCERLETREAA